jgi:twitching motility two-component system response regulator PilG
MQGALQEIDIRSLLELFAGGQCTGHLLIETAIPHNAPLEQPGWQVSFLLGKITYAGHPMDGQDRVLQLLRRYGLDSLKEIETTAHQDSYPWEYAAILTAVETQVLTPEQAQSILRQMIQESLLEIMHLHQGRFFFLPDLPGTQTAIASFEVPPLVQWLVQQRQEWQGFYPYIQSPDHCPKIVQPEALGQALSAATVNTLLKFADGLASLRQLSHRFDRNLNMVARAIYPCVQRGWIEMVSEPTDPMVSKAQVKEDKVPDAPPWRIVCLDDDGVMRQALRLLLEQYHCQVTALAQPTEAFSSIFQIKPHLIFCAIAMPQLDGYEVCAMLRQTARFRQTPIIMLTGQDGYINRIRAKQVGATAYLSKPVQETELVMLLEMHLGWKGVKKHFSQYLDAILAPVPAGGTMEESTVFPLKSD